MFDCLVAVLLTNTHVCKAIHIYTNFTQVYISKQAYKNISFSSCFYIYVVWMFLYMIFSLVWVIKLYKPFVCVKVVAIARTNAKEE